jgi:hypothetical protein
VSFKFEYFWGEFGAMFEIILGPESRDQIGSFDEKIRGRKSRDTVTLKIFRKNYNERGNMYRILLLRKGNF